MVFVSIAHAIYTRKLSVLKLFQPLEEQVGTDNVVRLIDAFINKHNLQNYAYQTLVRQINLCVSNHGL